MTYTSKRHLARKIPIFLCEKDKNTYKWLSILKPDRQLVLFFMGKNTVKNLTPFFIKSCYCYLGIYMLNDACSFLNFHKHGRGVVYHNKSNYSVLKEATPGYKIQSNLVFYPVNLNF